MTNDEYQNQVSIRISHLLELRKTGVQLSARIIGKNYMKCDMYFCATVDRSIRLIDGMIPLLKDRNLTCCGGLLRMQMDNCMRTYAAFIAEDPEALFNCVIEGNPINKLKDKNGNKLSDVYLKEQLTKYGPQFATVYGNASGFVHLSEKAFYQTVESVDNDHFCFNIGHPLPEKRNVPLLESAAAFEHFVRLHYKLLEAVAESKTRYDAEHVNDE